MNREIIAKNAEDFEQLAKENLEISNILVNTIFSNLNTTKKHIYAFSVILEETDNTYDITINRDSFRDILEKNLYIQEKYENYETCNKILETLKKSLFIK